jgi:hypothetical protein
MGSPTKKASAKKSAERKSRAQNAWHMRREVRMHNVRHRLLRHRSNRSKMDVPKSARMITRERAHEIFGNKTTHLKSLLIVHPHDVLWQLRFEGRSHTGESWKLCVFPKRQGFRGQPASTARNGLSSFFRLLLLVPLSE